MSSKKLNKSANNEECSFSYQKVSKIWTLVDEITKKWTKKADLSIRHTIGQNKQTKR